MGKYILLKGFTTERRKYKKGEKLTLFKKHDRFTIFLDVENKPIAIPNDKNYVKLIKEGEN